MLASYLKRQYKLLLLLALIAAIFTAVFSLYDLPVEPVVYAAALCLAAGGVLFALSFWRYVRRRRDLARRGDLPEEAAEHLPPPGGALEADYQALLRAVCADRAAVTADAENARRDMEDYYTMWVHQIKTPISAMTLLLQDDGGAQSGALRAELLKIDNYVEMVLGYLRLTSDTSDYVFRACALDDVVRAAVRKYARLFILKHLTLDFQETGRTIVTDEKWLGFVLGQLLTNAVKYTPEGGTIRIYGDGETLVVADTGIGIREEDLPRIFDKGFTGYNGREDRKSTGIGLYLSRRILEKLGAGITVASRPGRGTLVRLTLSSRRQMAE
jgi:signal transduction histidine kinase